MELKIQGLSDVFNIIGTLFKGVKSAAEIPAEAKKEMNDALADTAGLIDETLTILKQHLSAVIAELRFGDEDNARRMIFDLANFQLWEQKYRQFELCDALRQAAMNLERKGLYQLKSIVSYGKPEDLQRLIWDYIGGESNAAQSVGEMLVALSRKGDFKTDEKENMIADLDKARTEITTWRQNFVDIEKEIRMAVR